LISMLVPQGSITRAMPIADLVYSAGTIEIRVVAVERLDECLENLHIKSDVVGHAAPWLTLAPCLPW
jgi:hypothetical protein